MKLVEALRQRKAAMGWSITEVAAKLEVSYGCVTKLLAGQTVPRGMTAVVIRAVLDKAEGSR